MKGRAITDHLAHCSPKRAKEIQGDFLDEDIMGIEVESWKMYFDGATNQNGSGIGVLLISPKGTHIPFSGRLNLHHGVTSNPGPRVERVGGVRRLSLENLLNLK